MLTVSYWISSLAVAATAVCFAYVLVYDDNALLCPIIRWCRITYRARYGRELDEQRWWKPIWGCPMCVAGQWAFWGYLLIYPLAAYHLPSHLAFTAFTIFFAAGLRAFYAVCQNQ